MTPTGNIGAILRHKSTQVCPPDTKAYDAIEIMA